MELKTLFIGMTIAMAAFSVKAGIGWAYIIFSRPEQGARRRVVAFATVPLIYSALFAGIYALVVRVDILAFYEAFRPILGGGMFIHWMAALFIFAWGLILLKRGRSSDCRGHSGAWLALVIPCPVCATVLVMSASCLALYFPDKTIAAIVGLYAAFLVIAAASALTMRFMSKSGSGISEETLGVAMMLTAAYFIVSALVMPRFSEIGKVYRLASYASENRRLDMPSIAFVLGAALTVFCSGFFHFKWSHFKWRRMTSNDGSTKRKNLA
ncbi:MAG: DUF2162 domain-containing protein [Synergistaceae bacterium]|jgi:predicted transporter|nr:DUF2162 domain-containing protein [Synergistaceae bacterium]